MAHGPRGTSEAAALLTSPWQGCKPQLRPVKVHRPSMHSRTLKERLGKWDIGQHLKDCQAEHYQKARGIPCEAAIYPSFTSPTAHKHGCRAEHYRKARGFPLHVVCTSLPKAMPRTFASPAQHTPWKGCTSPGKASSEAGAHLSANLLILCSPQVPAKLSH